MIMETVSDDKGFESVVLLLASSSRPWIFYRALIFSFFLHTRLTSQMVKTRQLIICKQNLSARNIFLNRSAVGSREIPRADKQ